MSLPEAIVAQAPDAIIYVDRDGAVVVWNQAAERLFGWTAAEMAASGLDAIIPERFQRAHWDGFQKAIDTGVTKYNAKVLTTRSMHKDGSTMYVDLSFGLLRDDAGKVLGAMAMARDCTARYLAERDLRARMSTLQGQSGAAQGAAGAAQTPSGAVKTPSGAVQT